VGLPNCGKSSLFNCIVGERLAIVDKEYGMTRDRREFNVIEGMVTVVDTPGVEVNLLAKNRRNLLEGEDGYDQAQLKQDIFQQTMTAID
jgi:predicted GTPase